MINFRLWVYFSNRVSGHKVTVPMPAFDHLGTDASKVTVSAPFVLQCFIKDQALISSYIYYQIQEKCQRLG